MVRLKTATLKVLILRTSRRLPHLVMSVCVHIHVINAITESSYDRTWTHVCSTLWEYNSWYQLFVKLFHRNTYSYDKIATCRDQQQPTQLSLQTVTNNRDRFLHSTTLSAVRVFRQLFVKSRTSHKHLLSLLLYVVLVLQSRLQQRCDRFIGCDGKRCFANLIHIGKRCVSSFSLRTYLAFRVDLRFFLDQKADHGRVLVVRCGQVKWSSGTLCNDNKYLNMHHTESKKHVMKCSTLSVVSMKALASTSIFTISTRPFSAASCKGECSLWSQQTNQYNKFLLNTDREIFTTQESSWSTRQNSRT